jgi:hypothetical protein
MPGISVKKIERALAVFAREGLLLRYTVDGIDYIAMPPEVWFADQTHIRPEKRERDGSHFPPPPQSCPALEDGLNSGLEASAPGDLAADCCDLHAVACRWCGLSAFSFSFSLSLSFAFTFTFSFACADVAAGDRCSPAPCGGVARA